MPVVPSPPAVPAPSHLARLLTQPLAIHHRGPTEPPTTDKYGNEITVETDTVLVNGYVEQTEAQEMTVDRQTYMSDWLVVLPAEAVISGRDWVSHGDRTLEIIGSPAKPWNPRTRSVHHIEARAREVVG